MIKAYDFPGKGVGCYVFSIRDQIIQIGIHLTDLLGQPLFLEAVPNSVPGNDAKSVANTYKIIRRFGEAVSDRNWPQETGTKREIGNAVILFSDNDVNVSLHLERKAIGGEEVTVSPPAPKYVDVQINGVFLAS